MFNSPTAKRAARLSSMQKINPTVQQSAKPILLCLLMFFAISIYSFAQSNTWVQKADFGYDAANVPKPIPNRQGAVGFSIGNKGYVGTGTTGNMEYLKDFWEYDPLANTWTQKADFSGNARTSAVGFGIGSKGYLGTGQSGEYPSYTYYKDFWEYDPTANAWTQKADFGGDACYRAVGFSIRTKGYIGTGTTSSILTKEFWEYDPATNTWTQKADFGGNPRLDAVGFSIGNKGYIGTGSDENGITKKDFWKYDPAANTWTRKADFGGAEREKAVGFSIGSKGYIGKGFYYDGTTGNNCKDFWEYDPAANTWTRKADAVAAGFGDVGFSIGNKGYIGTMLPDYIYTKDFWEYDPVANTWTQKADFGGTERTAVVGFSIGSKGYIGTGVGSQPYYKDFWEYDPIANIWTQKADFGGTARHSAVGFSIGSKGYIGTGYYWDGTTEDYPKDFWEYDPEANTWTRKADFVGDSRADAVGFSIGSKGYIGGGYHNTSPYYYKDFWEYDPTANAWTQKADFGGTAGGSAVGFSIGSKGYIGMGMSYEGPGHYYKDFWEYDPTSNAWTKKADFGGTARGYAVGFSIGSKGYIGTGYYWDGTIENYYKDFWEYDPAANTWTQKADFGGTARHSAVGFGIGSKGYIGTGYSNISPYYYKDFWEYTPSGVLPLQFISFNAALQKTNALLNWQTTNEINTAYFNIQRSFNHSNFINIEKQNATGNGNAQQYQYTDANVIAQQQPKIFYRLQCVDIDGSSTYSNIVQLKVNSSNDAFVTAFPNPSKGNFTLQMQLPVKAASTTLMLYNNFGVKLWQLDAGWLSGLVNRNIELENKLSAGVYVLMVQHGDMRLMQKVVVIK